VYASVDGQPSHAARFRGAVFQAIWRIAALQPLVCRIFKDAAPAAPLRDKRKRIRRVFFEPASGNRRGLRCCPEQMSAALHRMNGLAASGFAGYAVRTRRTRLQGSSARQAPNLKVKFSSYSILRAIDDHDPPSGGVYVRRRSRHSNPNLTERRHKR